MEKIQRRITTPRKMCSYDKAGIKSGSHTRLTYPDLEPGETGTIKLRLGSNVTLAQVGRIVFSH